MKIIPGPRGKYQLKSEYDERIVRACREIPGMKWNASVRAWEGYSDALEQVCLRLKELNIIVEDAEKTCLPREQSSA